MPPRVARVADGFAKYLKDGGTDGGTIRTPTKEIARWRGLPLALQSPPGQLRL